MENARSEGRLDARRREDIREMGGAAGARRRDDGNGDGSRDGAEQHVVKARAAAVSVYTVDEQFASAEPARAENA